MKFHVGISLAVLMFFGCRATLGDQSSGLEETGSNQITEDSTLHCPNYDTSESTVEEIGYWERLAQCTDIFFRPSYSSDLLRPLPEEEQPLVLRQFCSALPTVKQCYANITSLSEACQDQHQQNLFKIHRSNFESGLDIGFYQGGERLVTIHQEGKKHIPKEQLETCLNEAARFNPRYPANGTTVTLQMYRAVKSFKNCIVDLGKDHEDKLGVNTIEMVLAEFLASMRCAAKEQDNGMLCEGLDIVSN